MNFTNMKSLFSNSSRKRNWLIAITSFIAFSIIYGFILFETSKHSITVILDGEEQTLSTRAASVEEILQDLDVAFNEKDYVYPALDSKVTNHMQVIWEPAKQVQLTVGEEIISVWTTADTVEELLREQDITLAENDQVTPKLSEQLAKDTKVQIQKAFAVKVNDGGEEKEVWSVSTTVADFLKQQGFTLGELDRVEPGLDKLISQNDGIQIIRVEKVTDVVEESTDYAVVTQKDSSLEKGVEKVVQSGKSGKVKKEYEVIKENGKEVDRKLVTEEVVEKAEDKIVAVGTKVVTAQVSRGTTSSSAPSSSAREFYVSATAYTAFCNGCSGVTATGIDLRANPNSKVIAVDPSVIPLGTKVWVEGYGYAVAADTGSAIKGNKIDLFFSSKSDALAFGRKNVLIKILD
ncbi:G5 and 3D domain-containing protein [Bacillus coahuilensis]|nr:G5 and 3D domain-containing protein [Bacillus coahuilensis]